MITCSEPIALAALFWPLALTIPASLLCGWMALSLFLKRGKLYFRASHKRESTQREMRKGQ